MNRTIKFRGKRIDNGEWAYGCLTRYSEEVSYITVDIIENEIHGVKTKTVGQFTGLKDKNGKEIYEGDIILVEFSDRKENHQVIFQDGMFTYNDGWALAQGNKDCEIIGNIYENPELIK